MTDENIIITENESPYDFDGIRKEFIRDFRPSVIRDIVLEVYEAIDIERGTEFPEKETREISHKLNGCDDSMPKWYVDNLLKIWLKDGREEWVLLHNRSLTDAQVSIK